MLSSSVAHAGVIPSGRTLSPSGFEENKGQVLTTAGDAAPFVRFLAKFNASGVRQWATYYGGMINDHGESCAVGGSGNVYLAGLTYSDTAISSEGYQNT